MHRGPLVLSEVLGERKCALIDLAARLAGDRRDLGHRLLDAEPAERVAQQRIDVHRLGQLLRRGDHDHELAAGLRVARIVCGKLVEIAASHLLVQLGELPTQGGRARAELRRKISEAGRNTASALVQHQRGWQPLQLSDARATLQGLGGQEPFKPEMIGRQAAARERCERRRWSRQGRHHVAGVAGCAHQLEAGV